jgi:uncharacterized DUF497 family protein
MDLQFEWDDDKCTRNSAKHGIDFLDATRAWADRTLTEQSNRNGEERYLTIGTVDGQTIAIAWTRRGETRRIISARPARRHEKEDYTRHVERGSNPAG